MGDEPSVQVQESCFGDVLVHVGGKTCPDRKLEMISGHAGAIVHIVVSVIGARDLGRLRLDGAVLYLTKSALIVHEGVHW